MIYQEVRRLLHLRSAWTASGLYIYWFLIKFTPLKMNGFGPLNLSLIVGTCQDSLTGKSHNGFDNAVFSKNQKELKNQNLIYRSHLSHFSTIFILMWFWRTTYILSTFFTYRYWLKRKLYSLILLYIAAWERSDTSLSPVNCWDVSYIIMKNQVLQNTHNIIQMIRSDLWL